MAEGRRKWNDDEHEDRSEDTEAPQEADLDDDAADAETLPCPSCGREVYEETQRCPHCGVWVTPGSARSRRPIWIVVLAALLLASLLLWLM